MKLYCFLAQLFLLLAMAPTIARGQQGSQALTPATLASQLTAAEAGERKKVEAIFHWITDNISYNIKAFQHSQSPVIYEEPDDTLPVLKPLTERVAQTVIRRGSAVCDGYARLFQSLCEFAGIKSEIITGYARLNWDRNLRRFRSNHKWNAVRIDRKWYLLDATWASGFINFRGDQFIREYDGSYFLTPPEQFIRDHYPEDLRWTLLENPVVPAEFERAPFQYNAFVRAGIRNYSPGKGFIEASTGDTVRFRMESNMSIHAFRVSDQPPPEEEEWTEWDRAKAARTVEATFVVPGVSSGWLYLICEGETVVRYRLSIKPPPK